MKRVAVIAGAAKGIGWAAVQAMVQDDAVPVLLRPVVRGGSR